MQGGFIQAMRVNVGKSEDRAREWLFISHMDRVLSIERMGFFFSIIKGVR